MAVTSQIALLDAFPKLRDDFRVRTLHGAIISIISLIFCCTLFISELSFFTKTDVVDHFFMNGSHDRPILVDFDITFHRVACSILDVDAYDQFRHPQGDVKHNIFRIRVDLSGKPLSEKEKIESLHTIHSESDLHHGFVNSEENNLQSEPKCGDCYGAGNEGECCNSCEEVRLAYHRRGWAFLPHQIPVCQSKAVHNFLSSDINEGCNVHGSIEVTKATGNFHFGPGKMVEDAKNHITSPFEFITVIFHKFNVSHTINKLSFGPDFLGLQNPLNGETRRIEEGFGMQQYYLKLVPTTYKKISGETIFSNQYAVTEHLRLLTPGSNRGMPGVYFFYEVSPIHVEFEEKRKGLWQFLTSVCAIIGGFFTVFGIIDSFIYSFSQSSSKKTLD